MTIDDFEDFYGKYGPMVLRRCRYLLKDEDKALDAMQDVFVRVLERRERLSSVCSSLFYTIATTVCLNKMRSDKVRQVRSAGNEFLDAIADPTAANHETLTDTAIFLDFLFEGGKDDTRYMAVLHYVDGLTLEETAKEMAMSVSGVRKRLSVLRKKALNSIGE